MTETNQDSNITEIKEGIPLAFEKLLGLLKLSVPVAAGVSVAAMLGSTTIEIQSFMLPRMIASLAAIVLLILVYVGCYKATLSLLRFFEALLASESGDEVTRQSAVIRNETSILNPFSSTRVQLSSEKSVTDYFGLIAIHLPVAIVLITSAWVLSEVRQDTAKALEVIEHYEVQIGEFELPPLRDGVTQRDLAILAAQKEVDKAADSIMLGLLYFFIRGIFFVLFGYFLYRIWQLIMIVNVDDAFGRSVILLVSMLVLFIPVFVIDIIWYIKIISFTVKTT